MARAEAAPQSPSGSIQLLSRATQILRALHGEPDGLSLSRIAERAELPRSTVHRLLAALEAEGLVTPTPKGRMRLGPELVRLGGGGPPPVQELLRPVLGELFDDLQETVDLAVLDSDHLRFVDQIAAPHRLRAVSSVGATFPLHCTANGKAVLALLSDAAIMDLLPEILPRYTANTVTVRSELLAEIAAIRSGEPAVDREEHTSGICAMGIAVGAVPGRHAAITVPMPTQRFEGREDAIAVALANARTDATRRLADDEWATDPRDR